MSEHTKARRMRKNVRRRRKKNPILPTLCALVILMLLVAGVIWLRPRGGEKFDPYPIRYEAEIAAAAEEFDLPIEYLYAVVLAESSFRPEAESSVGALGLMQIMPDTGKWIAGKFGMADTYTPEMLTDPALNVRFGSWYLKFLLDRYDGDMRCASAAYHAGQGTVDKWLTDPEKSPDGQTLAVIAYDSTDNYVNKVMRNYEAYCSLLSEDG